MSLLIPEHLRRNPVAIRGRSVREMFAERDITTITPGTPGTPDTLGPAEWAGGTWADPLTGRRYTVRRVGPLGVGGSWVHPLTGALIPITVIPGTPGTPATSTTVRMEAPATLGIAAAGGSLSLVPAGVMAAAAAPAAAAVGVTRLEESGGRIFGVPCTGVAPAGPDWRGAVAALSWALPGLPWPGIVEGWARAGLWVRRQVWPAGRMVRYVAGAGTTRAVAVRETGAAVTADDFAGAEWVGCDWTLADVGSEPPAADVTDWVFAGPASSQAFFVEGQAESGDDGGGESPAAAVVPSRGRGFLYARDGRIILVAAETTKGVEWRP